MKIHTYHTAKNVRNFLQAYIEKQGLEYGGNILQQEIPNDIEVLILHSPMKWGNIYISTEWVWKKYLAKHYPNVKLVVGGFTLFMNSPNYMQFLEMPLDFKTHLEMVQSTKENWGNWESNRMDATRGLEMAGKLHRFFLGHNTGRDGISWSIGQVCTIIISGQEDLEYISFKEARQKMVGQDILQHWIEFRNRWTNYKHLLEILPFHLTIHQINHYIKNIKPFFDNQCQDETVFNSIVEQVEWIYDELNELKIYAKDKL